MLGFEERINTWTEREGAGVDRSPKRNSQSSEVKNEMFHLDTGSAQVISSSSFADETASRLQVSRLFLNEEHTRNTN